MFNDFDSNVTAEEFYGEDFSRCCPACLCETCECEDVALSSNPCVHCGLVFGECDCDEPENYRERRDQDDYQYDRIMYEESDLHHEC